MSEVHRSNYSEQLIEWGHSGSLYPNLIPNEQDYEQLLSLQERLQLQFPGSEPVEKLHTTIFYVKPRSLYEYMKTNINPSLQEEWLYMDLSNNFATLAWLFPGCEMNIDGIARFGSDGSVAALELSHTSQSSNFIRDLRELVITTITRNGATFADLETMRNHPKYRWLIGESKPHISLLKGIDDGQIPTKLELPSKIRFDGLADGSVQAPEDDPYRWYVMPLI